MGDSVETLGAAQRVATLAERVEGYREVLEDGTEARDKAIYEAVDVHGATIKQVATWAKMSTANVSRIVERRARAHG